MSDGSRLLDAVSVRADNVRALEEDLADEMAARDNAVRQAHEAGVSVRDLAGVLGVSVQRVYRIARGLR